MTDMSDAERSKISEIMGDFSETELTELRAAARIARQNPELPASGLVLDLIDRLGQETEIPHPDSHGRLTRAIVRIWQLDRAGQGAIRALEDAVVLVDQLPELPASDGVRRLGAIIRHFPHDPGSISGMRAVMRDILDISIPGISRLIDQGWTLHDRDLRHYGVEGLLVEVYPGVWARRPAEEPAPERSGIYMASKAVAHGPRWQALREEGWPIISTWIDESQPDATLDWPDLWERCLAEVTSAEVCIVYMEPGEVLKGAWVEVGAALAAGVHVIGVGVGDFSISKSDKIIMCDTLDEALELARGIMDGNALFRDARL